jgi:hypothetical protein
LLSQYKGPSGLRLAINRCVPLRRLFKNGKVLCRPQPEGFYIAQGTLFPLALFSMRLSPQTPKPDDFGDLRPSGYEEAQRSLLGLVSL